MQSLWCKRLATRNIEAFAHAARLRTLYQQSRFAVGARILIVQAPASFALAGLKIAGLLLGDVVLTRDEVKGLTREYLYAPEPLRRGADFAEWLARPAVASTLGRNYESELARHFRLE
jgi:hypothetical protein